MGRLEEKLGVGKCKKEQPIDTRAEEERPTDNHMMPSAPAGESCNKVKILPFLQ